METDTALQRCVPAEGEAPSPAAVFVRRLVAAKSRATMTDSLNRLARILLSDPKATADLVPWQKLRPEHVDAILATLAERYAPATANKHLAALRGVVKTMRRMKLITADQMADLLDFEARKGRRPLAGRCLSPAEVSALFTACTGYPRDAAVLVLAFCAGLRRFEIAELTVTGYFQQRELVQVPGKGDAVREVPIAQEGKALLDWWLAVYQRDRRKPLAPNDPLVCRFTKHGAPGAKLSDAGVYEILVRAGERAKIAHFSPHDLRRTFITELLERGNDPLIVARLAGHKDVKTTMLYDRRPEHAARVAANTLGNVIPVGING